VRLADVIGRVLGTVEIVLAGVESDLRDGQTALVDGDAFGARAAARRVLARAPRSPIGLALLADACEAADLHAELCMVLEELSERAPSRAEVWVRLGRARLRTGAPPQDVRRAFAAALSVADPGSEERSDSLLALADIDLANSDPHRAELWLERLSPTPATAAAVAVRRAEAWLLLRDPVAASQALDAVEWSAIDGRAALARGRALGMQANPSAIPMLLRAMILEAPGASEALSSSLAQIPTDAEQRSRIARVVELAGEQDFPRWRAAFAGALGKRDEARAALVSAVSAGELGAAYCLLEAALDDRDGDALGVALQALDRTSADALTTDGRRISEALAGLESRPSGALSTLEWVSHPRSIPWATDLCEAVARLWIPDSEKSVDWAPLLGRMSVHARANTDLESLTAIGDIATSLHQPIRMAIVGEFNAGKSTFINALIGSDVAPTGVLPTTASIHHLQWAPDPFVRVTLAPGQTPTERIVPITGLRDAMRSLEPSVVDRVEILMPLDFLRRIEVIDTPGFNAGDPRHAAIARSALEEADIALWLVDATQASKHSEQSILEEVHRLEVPVRVIVNKIDRLNSSDLARVMSFVDESFAAGGLGVLAPALALSAKKALSGRLGDDAALEQSGWRAVHAMLEEEIVARSDRLKERTLRKRARRIVAVLARRAASDLDAYRKDSEKQSQISRAVGLAGAELDRDPNAAISRLTADLSGPWDTLQRDLSEVFAGRRSEDVPRDDVMDRYVVERTLDALGRPLASALASLSGPASVEPAELLPLARALLRGALGMPMSSPRELYVASLAKASVATLVEYLFAKSTGEPPESSIGGVMRELEALGQCLSAGPYAIPASNVLTHLNPKPRE